MIPAHQTIFFVVLFQTAICGIRFPQDFFTRSYNRAHLGQCANHHEKCMPKKLEMIRKSNIIVSYNNLCGSSPDSGKFLTVWKTIPRPETDSSSALVGS